MSRCNNSSPRICVRNHYAILAHLKISYVFDLQDKHNASYFYPNVTDRTFLSACKITQKHSLQQAIITYCSFLSSSVIRFTVLRTMTLELRLPADTETVRSINTLSGTPVSKCTSSPVNCSMRAFISFRPA